VKQMLRRAWCVVRGSESGEFLRRLLAGAGKLYRFFSQCDGTASFLQSSIRFAPEGCSVGLVVAGRSFLGKNRGGEPFFPWQAAAWPAIPLAKLPAVIALMFSGLFAGSAQLCPGTRPMGSSAPGSRPSPSFLLF